jgi:chromate reductase
MSTPKITTLCGSLRRASYNRMLLAHAVRAFGPCDVTDGDLRLPLYDGDIEAADGIPEAVTALLQQIAQADAVIIASPEYNSSISGVLKNALDWVSRVEGAPWKHKPVALMCAAAGRSGGARGLSALRLCLAPFRPMIVPGPEVLVAASYAEFGKDGSLPNEVYQKAIAELMADLRAAIK